MPPPCRANVVQCRPDVNPVPYGEMLSLNVTPDDARIDLDRAVEVASFFGLTGKEANIEIEKMRFGDKLRAHYEIGTNQFSILPLTIQPIVENSIRHGIYEKGKAGGDVYIRTKATEDAWVVEVEDNGIGFDVDEYMARQRTGQGDSTGLENIRFRLEKVMNAHLQIKSTKGIGTVVTLTIPKTYEQTYE